MNKGVYCLLIDLKEPKKIKIGCLGHMSFKRGYYCYVGSALNNLEKRVERHLKNPKDKKTRWHIDYFLKHAKIIDVMKILTNKKTECLVNNRVRKLSDEIITNFGSSDCRCKGHLHYFKKRPSLRLLDYKA